MYRLASRIFGFAATGLLILSIAADLSPLAPATTKASADSSATLITLHYKDAPANVVLDDLFRQTGYQLRYQYLDDGIDQPPPITIDADNQPFWQVFLAIGDDITLKSDPQNAGKLAVDRYPVQFANSHLGAHFVSGPCVFLIQSITHNAAISDTDHPNQCVLDGLILIEPHLCIANYPSSVLADSAVDENGNRLIGFMPTTFRVRPTLNFSTRLRISLSLPPNVGHKIADLKGVAHLNLFGPTRSIEIAAADFDKPQTVDYHDGKLTVTVATAKTTAPETQYDVSIKFARNNASDDDWTNIGDLLASSSTAFRDDHDQPYGSNLASDTGHTDDSCTFTQSCRSIGHGPAAKCVISVPESFVDMPLPYEFKDLPLP